MFNASLSAGKINQKNYLFIYLKSNMLTVFPLNKKTDLESEKLGVEKEFCRKPYF